MDEKEFKSLIFIAGMDKLYNTMNSLCIEASKFGSSNFRFLNGVSLIFGNRIQEGIRELNSLTNDNDVGIGSMLALIYGHKKCTIVDKEIVANLEMRIKEERKRVTGSSAYNAAIFLFFCGKYEKSKEYAEKTLKFHADHCESMVLKAYCLLMMGQRTKNVLEMFDRVANITESIDAILGEKFIILSIANVEFMKSFPLPSPMQEKMLCSGKKSELALHSIHSNFLNFFQPLILKVKYVNKHGR